MRIAILSGKGGTGKTFVSVNLAKTINEALYIDCDVEEPNGYLFLNPQNKHIDDVYINVPVINDDLCNGCRKCVNFCKFNALAYIDSKVILFKELCHSCNGCVVLCPSKAITNTKKKIGTIEKGNNANLEVITGILEIGENSGVPIIKKMLETSNSNVVIDCPPGASCLVMESIKDADYVVLVAENSVFGIHNMEMVYELVKLFGLKCGVIINKADENQDLRTYCLNHNLNILAEIPFDKEIAKKLSLGKIIINEDEKMKLLFNDIYTKIKKELMI